MGEYQLNRSDNYRFLEKVILTRKEFKLIFLAMIFHYFLNFHWQASLLFKQVIYQIERNFNLYHLRFSAIELTATGKRKKTLKKCTFCRNFTDKSVQSIKG